MPFLSGFHDGETAMRELLKVPSGLNPTAPGFPTQYAMRVRQAPLVAVGTLDDQSRPWTTIWGGERGFAGSVAQDVLGLKSAVDQKYDPVFEALWKEAGGSGSVQPNTRQGKIMSALAFDLETRDRVKLAGAFVAGVVVEDGEAPEVEAAMVVTESLGNCPKYINKKKVVRNNPRNAELVSDELPLSREALDLVYKADMFFVSSSDGETMDTNHRGGSPGFVRVLKNEGSEIELVYPEFSGNRLYQTLGNLKVNPAIGVTIPDYETADVLYLTGAASIAVGEEASSLLGRTQLAVRIKVLAARFVKGGLPFRGERGEFSPYNPPLRHLLSEKEDPRAVDTDVRSDIVAMLVDREVLTPTINTFTFKLSSSRGAALPQWEAGQHVSLDFRPELGFGYAHMRDEDPQSINDDFIRTFTVSSDPWGRDGEIQITARKHGPVTNFLWRHNIQAALEIPVLGFGGEAKFRLPTTKSSSRQVFVAGGVGITPLLAQARGVLEAGIDLTLLWSLRGEDLSLVVGAFERIPGLAGVTVLFVTGNDGADDALLARIKDLGVQSLETRRIGAEDVRKLKRVDRRPKFYLCAGPRLLRLLTEWLDGEDVVWEDFGY